MALHNEQQGLAVIFTHVVDCVHGISISAIHIRAKPGETIAKSTCRDLWMEVMLKLVHSGHCSGRPILETCSQHCL